MSSSKPHSAQPGPRGRPSTILISIPERVRVTGACQRAQGNQSAVGTHRSGSRHNGVRYVRNDKRAKNERRQRKVPTPSAVPCFCGAGYTLAAARQRGPSPGTGTHPIVDPSRHRQLGCHTVLTPPVVGCVKPVCISGRELDGDSRSCPGRVSGREGESARRGSIRQPPHPAERGRVEEGVQRPMSARRMTGISDGEGT